MNDWSSQRVSCSFVLFWAANWPQSSRNRPWEGDKRTICACFWNVKTCAAPDLWCDNAGRLWLRRWKALQSLRLPLSLKNKSITDESILTFDLNACCGNVVKPAVVCLCTVILLHHTSVTFCLDHGCGSAQTSCSLCLLELSGLSNWQSRWL